MSSCKVKSLEGPRGSDPMPTLDFKSAAQRASFRPKSLGARAHEIPPRVLSLRRNVLTLRHRTVDPPIAVIPLDVVISAFGYGRLNSLVRIVFPNGVIRFTFHAEGVITLRIVTLSVGAIEDVVVLDTDTLPHGIASSRLVGSPETLGHGDV